MELINTIRQVGNFIICAQTLIHFRPNESYGKYMRLLVSVMVLVQLVIPIFSFFQIGSNELFTESIASYENSMRDQMDIVNITGVMAEEKLEILTKQELQERIEAQEIATQEAAEDTTAQDTANNNVAELKTETTSEVAVQKIEEVKIEVGADAVE